jgi:hypothetical protein
MRSAYTKAGIDEFIITLDDRPGVNISSYFRAAIDVIHRTIMNGDAVLVHCDMGISRSITIVMAYLLWRAAHDARSLKMCKEAQVFRPGRNCTKKLMYGVNVIGLLETTTHPSS